MKNNNNDDIDDLLFQYYEDDKDIPEKTKYVIENTIKYKLKKNKKINYKFISTIAAVFLLFFLSTGIIFGKDIVSTIASIFDLKSNNLNNKGIIEAIYTKDYVQNIDMNYIDLNDDYKIKVNYLILDKINIYMVFSLISNKPLENNNYRLSITDIEISDENNTKIYSAKTPNANTDIMALAGWKNVKSNKNEIQEVYFVITSGLPTIKKMNISFSKVILYKKNHPSKNLQIQCNCNFSIDIGENFIDNDVYEYELKEEPSDEQDYSIIRCTATDTGLYIVYKAIEPNLKFDIDYDNVSVARDIIGGDTEGYSYFIMQFNLNTEKLKDEDIITLKKDDEKIYLYKTK